MRNKRVLNIAFNTNRKVLYIILSVVMISVLTLTVVYAALSTTLNINGNAEVTAASWNIYLDNVQLNSSSATSNLPTITDSRTATFSTTLSKPGDIYEFTIDVVNNGSIDAMIDSVTKTPTLTETQAKYLNYTIEYQNGEAINTKQLVSKNSYVRLKVKVEFRKDITASDLPSQSETLSLSFKVNYVQSDESGTSVTDNGVKKAYKIVSGDLETVGSEISIGDEHFYIISSNETSITMIAKYNLYVGSECTSSSSCIPYGEEATGLQDSTMTGYISDQLVRPGVTAFSASAYWESTEGIYVYNSNSTLYDYVENYKIYLESQGANIEEARLIKIEELEKLGCSRKSFDCSNAPEWVYETTYWTGTTGIDNESIWRLYAGSSSYTNYLLNDDFYSVAGRFGVRPVIVLKY